MSGRSTLGRKVPWDYGPLRVAHKKNKFFGVDSVGHCAECGREWAIYGPNRVENARRMRMAYRAHVSRAKGEMDVHKKGRQKTV